MNMAQVRCNGCNKLFTLSGLSQHIAKTPDVRCHLVYGTSQAHVAQLTNNCIARTPASSIALNPSVTPRIDTSGDNQIEDAFDNSVDDHADVMDAEPLEIPPQQGANPLPVTSDDPASGQRTQAFIIDRFPSASAGAPISGPHEDPSLAVPDRSIWAPFRSQCDWEFALWAKMRGPTSSAVTDLLAIPEVCAPYLVSNFGANIL